MEATVVPVEVPSPRPRFARKAPAALVLLSGGLDSAVALYWARAQGWRTEALTFDYHLRPPREVAATVAVARRAGIERVHRVPVPWLREAVDVPEDELQNPELATVPEGYVPARNLVFYAVAAHYAEILGTPRLVGGHHGRDPERFPDASPKFFGAFEAAAAYAHATSAAAPLNVELPLRDLDKAGIVRLGLALGVPLEDTWSCYGADALAPCGACHPCRERADAFATVGLLDPLVA